MPTKDKIRLTQHQMTPGRKEKHKTFDKSNLPTPSRLQIPAESKFSVSVWAFFSFFFSVTELLSFNFLLSRKLVLFVGNLHTIHKLV